MNKKIVFIILLFTSFLLKAQEESDCAKTLKNAQKVYDSGEIEKVEALLISCLEDGFTRAQKTEALKVTLYPKQIKKVKDLANSKYDGNASLALRKIIDGHDANSNITIHAIIFFI